MGDIDSCQDLQLARNKDMLQLILGQFFFLVDGSSGYFFEALIYVSFVLISCALFSKFWIEAIISSDHFGVARISPTSPSLWL